MDEDDVDGGFWVRVDFGDLESLDLVEGGDCALRVGVSATVSFRKQTYAPLEGK